MRRKPLIGAHLSIAGGFDKAIITAHEIGATALQIFTKSSRSWLAKPILKNEVKLFLDAQKQYPTIKAIVAHTGYLINLASNNKDTEQKSIQSLIKELARADALELDALILHPGSHCGQGEEQGMVQIAKNLDIVFEKANSKTMLLLETAAGQGSNLGYRFEQLAQIMELSQHKKNLGVCLDTCHIFSAGYDIATIAGYKKVMLEFDTIIGFSHLKAIHLNNSKNGCGAKLDRHEKISEGKIPLEVFKEFMQDIRLEKIPKILETPLLESVMEYKEEIELLRNL